MSCQPRVPGGVAPPNGSGTVGPRCPGRGIQRHPTYSRRRAERVTDPDSTEAWLSALPGTAFAASPEEHPITIGADLHTSHPAHIGRADEDGRFTIIKSWPASAPDPYPALLLDANGMTDDGVSSASLSG
jgi:hypothetical protein